MEKYLYFRKSATLTDDHDGESGSVLYPASALRGMVAGDATAAGVVTDDDDRMTLYFTPMANIAGGAGAALTAVDNQPDIVLLDLTAVNTQKAVYAAIVDALSATGSMKTSMIDVYDAVNGTGIPGVSGIHVVTAVIND